MGAVLPGPAGGLRGPSGWLAVVCTEGRLAPPRTGRCAARRAGRRAVGPLMWAVCGAVALSARFAAAERAWTVFAEVPGGSDSIIADKAYWNHKCRPLPQSRVMIRVQIGSVVDYFKPAERTTLCQMLTSDNKHLWSPDPDLVEWRVPSSDPSFGGSGLEMKWMETRENI